MDVTDIVNKWVSGSIHNNGFIIKRSGSLGLITTGSNDDEGNTKRFGNLSFFSSDTHTKYPPSLEVEWDDSVWTTFFYHLYHRHRYRGFGNLYERIKT